MSNSKISALTSATTPLAGTEVLPVVQSSTTKQVSVANLTAGRAVSAASLALTTPLPASSGGTGLSALGTGVATWLGTPSSANLAAAVTDETGSGSLVFGTNPTFYNSGSGNPSANFANSAFQDVLVNYFNAAGTTGNKITLQFASNGGSTTTNAITSYGSAYGGGLNNAIEIGNSSGNVRVTTAGDAFLTTGNLVVSNGKGIDFSATPGTGTSELLNDYEEGTWTPVIIGSSTAGSGTYSLQEGFYTKIGRQVTVTGAIVWSAHTGTGTMRVSGLPYTIKNDNNYSSFALQYGTLTVSALAIAFIVTRPGQTYLQVDETVAGGSSQSGVPVDTAASLYFQATYFV